MCGVEKIFRKVISESTAEKCSGAYIGEGGANAPNPDLVVGRSAPPPSKWWGGGEVKKFAEPSAPRKQPYLPSYSLIITFVTTNFHKKAILSYFQSVSHVITILRWCLCSYSPKIHEISMGILAFNFFFAQCDIQLLFPLKRAT